MVLKHILGEQGEKVVKSLMKSSPDLRSYLIPRVIISWLRQSDYGTIPNDTFSQLSKNGYGYSGICNIEGISYRFSNVSEEHVAAIISVVSNETVSTVQTKEIDLAKLAKTIDLLVKAQKRTQQFEHQENARNLEPIEPVQPTSTQPATNQIKPTEKQPTKFKVKIPRLPKTIKLTQKETLKKCNVCDQKLFDKNTFVGCTCFKPLAKNTETSISNGQVVLTLGSNWDDDACLTIIEMLKNGN